MNPIFAKALSPFAPPQSEVHQIAKEPEFTARLQPPSGPMFFQAESFEDLMAQIQSKI